jgi:hypothetical protein
MKQILLLIQILCVAPLYAQEFNASNSSSRIGMVYYVEDGNGFFQKKENVELNKVSDPISVYAYDKKTQNLYMVTKRGNCVICVNETYAKYYKKAKVYPFLKEDELKAAIEQKNKELEDKYNSINKARQKHINDSIEKVRQDSIKRALEDSLRLVKEKQKEIDYKKCHDWSVVPTKGNSLYCVLCEKSVTTRDSSFCYAIINDSIYWADILTGDLGLTYHHIHAAAVSTYLKQNLSYQYHTKVYRDSLENVIPIMSKSYAGLKDYLYYGEYLERLKKLAPHGYFLDWGWNNEYSSVTFNFKS